MRRNSLLRFVSVIFLAVVTLGLGAPVRAQPAGIIQVELKATPNAAANGWGGVTGTAILDRAGGWIVINLKPSAGAKLPAKAVLEGWLVDLGSLEANNPVAARIRDQKFGPAYANRTLGLLTESIPYWLSTGALIDDGKGGLTSAIRWPNYNFGPYDTVTVTIETDGNETPWDPRPGAPVARGQISDAKPYTGAPIDIDKLIGPMPDLTKNTGTQATTLRVTKLAEQADLNGATGRAFVLIEAAAAQIEVRLAAGTKVPEGAVLEAWVVDGGKLSGFGPSNAHLLDNKWGPTDNNPYISAIADAVPMATSLGVLKPDAQGVLRLEVHWQKYAFRVYDLVMVTIEADGDKAPWNPRPGTPALVGPINPKADPAGLLALPDAAELAAPADGVRPAATAAPTQAK